MAASVARQATTDEVTERVIVTATSTAMTVATSATTVVGDHQVVVSGSNSTTVALPARWTGWISRTKSAAGFRT